METHTFNESKKRFEPLNKSCSFCESKSENIDVEDNCYHFVYNVQDRLNLVVFRNVKYKEVEIGIPRCSSCKKVHSRSDKASNIAMLIGIPFVFIVPMYFGVINDFGMIGMGVLLLGTFGLMYFFTIGVEKAILKAYKVKSKKDGALLDPMVQDFLKSGWSSEMPSA